MFEWASSERSQSVSQEVVPYSIRGISEYPRQQFALTRPGRAQSIYIMLHPGAVDEAAARFASWFEGRDEVQIVDIGTSDKVGAGFIIMQWLECDIDVLFLAILRDEESVADYTLFGRAMEGSTYYGR
jgi:hypothetical protein